MDAQLLIGLYFTVIFISAAISNECPDDVITIGSLEDGKVEVMCELEFACQNGSAEMCNFTVTVIYPECPRDFTISLAEARSGVNWTAPVQVKGYNQQATREPGPIDDIGNYSVRYTYNRAGNDTEIAAECSFNITIYDSEEISTREPETTRDCGTIATRETEPRRDDDHLILALSLTTALGFFLWIITIIIVFRKRLCQRKTSPTNDEATNQRTLKKNAPRVEPPDRPVPRLNGFQEEDNLYNNDKEPKLYDDAPLGLHKGRSEDDVSSVHTEGIPEGSNGFNDQETSLSNTDIPHETPSSNVDATPLESRSEFDVDKHRHTMVNVFPVIDVIEPSQPAEDNRREVGGELNTFMTKHPVNGNL